VRNCAICQSNRHLGCVSKFCEELEKNFSPDTVGYVSSKVLLLQEYGFKPLVYYEHEGQRMLLVGYKGCQTTFNLAEVNRHFCRIADCLDPGLMSVQ